MKKTLMISILLLVSACGSVIAPINSSVTRTNAFAEDYLNGDIYFLQLPDQKVSVEYTNYRDYVGRKLEQHGFNITYNQKQARYAAIIDYGNSGSHQSLTSNQVYDGDTNSFNTVYRSKLNHSKYFRLRIFDIKRSTQDNFVGVYEGVVETSGSESKFYTVSHCLIDALFDDFLKNGTDDSDFGVIKEFRDFVVGGDRSCIQ